MTAKIINFPKQENRTAYTISKKQNFKADYLEVIAPSGKKRWFKPMDYRHFELFNMIKAEVKERGKSDLVLFL